jgi:hypothetical protein
MNKLQHGDAIKNITQDQWNVLRFVSDAVNIKRTPIFNSVDVPNGNPKTDQRDIVYGGYSLNNDCLWLNTHVDCIKNYISFEKFISRMTGMSLELMVKLGDGLKAYVDDDGAMINGKKVSHESISELYKASQHFVQNQSLLKQF